MGAALGSWGGCAAAVLLVLIFIVVFVVREVSWS